MRRLAHLIMYAGIVLGVVGLGIVHARQNDYPYMGSEFRITVAGIYAAVLAIAAYGAGLPDTRQARRQTFVSAVTATGSAALVISFIQFFAGDALLPRFVVLGSVLLLSPWLMFSAAIATGGYARAQERQRVLLIGDRAERKSLEDELSTTREKPAQLVTAMTVDETRSDAAKEDAPLIEAVTSERINTVVLSRQAQLDEDILSQAATVHALGVRVRTLSGFYEEWLGKLPISELERLSLLFDIREVHGTRYRRIKRLIDVVGGGIGLLALLVLSPLIVISNLVANRGPLFYRQMRVGKDGQHFEILKFRTMIPDQSPSDWTQEDDARVAPLGRVLRSTHLDELPQVINLLRGDLSLVGPRPEQPRYVQQLTETIPFYALRHLVQPGLTGWAQVNYRYGAHERDALEKLQYEFFYLRNQSLWLDLRIIGRTIRSVIGGSGR